MRREILLSPGWSIGSLLDEEQYTGLADAGGKDALERAGREIALAIVDDLWADYLANVAELRGGIHWISWGGGDPLFKFLKGVEAIYADFERCLSREVAQAFAAATFRDGRFDFERPERFERGATWTYVTTDQPFGSYTERVLKGLKRTLSRAR